MILAAQESLVIYSLDFQGNIVAVISLRLLLFYVFENLSGLSLFFFIIHSSIPSLQSIRLLPQGEKETSHKCHFLIRGPGAVPLWVGQGSAGWWVGAVDVFPLLG